MSSGCVGEEKLAMEKKPINRQSSVQPKGSVSDKKADSYGNSKQGRRGRREGNFPRGGGGRMDGPAAGRRGNYSPKPRYDKRQNYMQRGNPGDWQRQEVRPGDSAELGSAQRPGSKKESLSHLLNFTFAPRDGELSGGGGGRGGGGWRGYNRWNGKGHTFNKEQFLQANCQFIVKETMDYTQHMADPDLLVEWDLIEQVRIFSNEVPSCPICLYPPTAAKITRCGHIYCWSCMLHYLSLAEKSWGKCPICYEAIHQHDLKSVVALERHAYVAGEEITMKLMKRERGSTYALPHDQWRQRDGKPHHVDDAVDTCYAKLLLATPAQAAAILQQEQTALETQQAEEGQESLEGSYVGSALEMLKTRRESLGVALGAQKDVRAMLEKLEVSDESPDESPEVSPASITKGVTYADAFDDTIEESADISPGGDAAEDSADISPGGDAAAEESNLNNSTLEEKSDHSVDAAGDSPSVEVTKVMSSEVDDLIAKIDELCGEGPDLSPTSPDDKSPTGANQKSMTYYYYQASDGQHIYLHSVNARCLVQEYGSWERCPATITARIVDVESCTMEADVRRRLRYLGHLPLSCEFRVAELLLAPPLVSKTTLGCFQGEIDKRERARKKKSRQERRFDRRAQDAEDKKNGKTKGLRVSLGSAVHFPEDGLSRGGGGGGGGASAPVHIPAPPSITSSTASSPVSTPPRSPVPFALNPHACEFAPKSPAGSSMASVSSPEFTYGSPGGASDDSGQGGGVSFAKMLQSGKHCPSASSAAWPRPRSSRPSALPPHVTGVVQGSDSEGESEDRVPVPDYHAEISNAFQSAMDNYMIRGGASTGDVEDVNVEAADAGRSGGKGKKKKKQKQMLLFSTAMARKN